MKASRFLMIVEAVLVTLFFELSLEQVARAFLGEVVVHGHPIPGLVLFALACVLFGLWLQLRFARTLLDLVSGITLGVMLAFLVRALTGEVPYYPSDLPFTSGLVAANTGLILIGVLWARQRTGFGEQKAT